MQSSGRTFSPACWNAIMLTSRLPALRHAYQAVIHAMGVTLTVTGTTAEPALMEYASWLAPLLTAGLSRAKPIVIPERHEGPARSCAPLQLRTEVAAPALSCSTVQLAALYVFSSHMQRACACSCVCFGQTHGLVWGNGAAQAPRGASDRGMM